MGMGSLFSASAHQVEAHFQLSNLSDGTPLDGLSRNESVKAASNHLRGLIKEELVEEAPAFGDDSEQLLKFHGIYQQDDRDRRKEARAKGLDKHHQLMILTRTSPTTTSAGAGPTGPCGSPRARTSSSTACSRAISRSRSRRSTRVC